MYKVKKFSVLYVIAVVAHLSSSHTAGARPHNSLSRQKRISDQRLAELETLIALSKMKNKMVTIPIGFGRVDPLKVGRRKRSIEELIKDLALEQNTLKETGEEAEIENQKENANAEEENLLNQFFYDESQRMARFLLPSARVPE